LIKIKVDREFEEKIRKKVEDLKKILLIRDKLIFDTSSKQKLIGR